MGLRFNYTILGIFVVILSTGLFYGLYWFSGESDYKNYLTYLLYVDESVSGLADGSSVKYNGVSVGYVKGIQISRENFKQVEIVLRVVDGTPITEDTYATIVTHGITGLSHIGLKTVVQRGPLLKPKPGQRFPVIQSSPSLFVEIDEAVSEVTLNIKNLAKKFDVLLDDENQANFRNLLKNLANITKSISDRSPSIEASIESFERILVKFEEMSKNLPNITKKAETALDSFTSMSANVEKSSDQFNSTMDDTRHMISNISQQVVPELDKTLQQLERLMGNINILVADLQKNPSILVRGKKITNLGPGEVK